MFAAFFIAIKKLKLRLKKIAYKELFQVFHDITKTILGMVFFPMYGI